MTKPTGIGPTFSDEHAELGHARAAGRATARWFERTISRPACVGDVICGGLVAAEFSQSHWVMTGLLTFLWLAPRAGRQ